MIILIIDHDNDYVIKDMNTNKSIAFMFSTVNTPSIQLSLSLYSKSVALYKDQVAFYKWYLAVYSFLVEQIDFILEECGNY